MFVAGAAIFALDASASIAQDTTTRRPTSSQRISIKKESGGEVAPVVRVDTVYSYRTDTLRLPGRTDTVVTTNTVVRVDTVQIPMPEFLRQIGGLYFGLAGGSSLPAANLNDAVKPGWAVQGQLGIDPIGSPFGLRLTGTYGSHDEHSYAAPFVDNAKIMTAALDLKLRALTISPFNRRVHIYGIAGGTYNRFKNILENDDGVLFVGDTRLPGNVFTTPIDDGWHDGWGFNVGGGGEMGFGRTTLFVESRFSRFKGKETNISHVPLMIGLSWF
jgi:opacity protein-like surface antigen